EHGFCFGAAPAACRGHAVGLPEVPLAIDSWEAGARRGRTCYSFNEHRVTGFKHRSSQLTSLTSTRTVAIQGTRCSLSGYRNVIADGRSHEKGLKWLTRSRTTRSTAACSTRDGSR